MAADPSDLGELEAELGYVFGDRRLLDEALRHGSASNDRAGDSYERLEFFGDAVLGAVVARMLLERFPRDDQGQLTRKRSHLVRSASLAQKASLLGLDGWVELGASEARDRGWRRSALLEDLLEAVIGAVALDGGWTAAEGFVRRHLGPEVDALDERILVLANPKSALQEAAQAEGLPLPEYRQVGEGGADHRPRFAFVVTWKGEEIARGEGPSKREAQNQAARRALIRLGRVPEEAS